jgi:hypothetical protein
MSESTPNALGSADPLAPVRYLDVVLIVLAAPFVVLLELPALGYAVGAAVWIASRVLESVLERSAGRSDVRRAIGVKVGSMIGRTWLIGIGILAVGLTAEREDGFVAALLCLAAYTVHLATALILRPLEKNPK